MYICVWVYIYLYIHISQDPQLASPVMNVVEEMRKAITSSERGPFGGEIPEIPDMGVEGWTEYESHRDEGAIAALEQALGRRLGHRIDKQTNKQTSKQANKQASKQTNKQANKQNSKQANK